MLRIILSKVEETPLWDWRRWLTMAGLALLAGFILSACDDQKGTTSPNTQDARTDSAARTGRREWPLPAVISTTQEFERIQAGQRGTSSQTAVHKFSPTSAPPGGEVTLSGPALPNSVMSAYFFCDALCGVHHLGKVDVGSNGTYSLAFKVPDEAKAGGVNVSVGCDNCGNGWRDVRGLTIAGPPDPKGTHRFNPTETAPGAKVTLSGPARPNSYMSAYFFCDAFCGAHWVGKAEVGSGSTYSLTFVVPATAKAGAATITIGCDSPCPNGWREIRGLTINGSAVTHTLAPKEAEPGAKVTLSGRAAPKSSMSAYFSCEADCGLTHLKAVQTGADGTYSLEFKVPSAAKPGNAIVTVGCDLPCSNGWTKVSGLTIVVADPNRDDAIRQRVADSFLRAFGRLPNDGEAKQWLDKVKKNRDSAAFTTVQALIDNHHRPYLKNNVEEREATVRRAFVQLKFKPPEEEFKNWVGEGAADKIYEEMIPLFRKAMIVHSYPYAFGRAISNEEWSFWKGVSAGDSRLENWETLVGQHRSSLARTAALREQTMRQAASRIGYSELPEHFKVGITAGTCYEEMVQAFRKAMIPDSYRRAFGRDASESEMRQWVNISTNDPRLDTVDLLLKQHRNVLIANVAERHATVERAFVRTRSQQYEDRVRLWRERAKGLIFEQMVPEILIHESYWDAFGRLPYSDEVIYWRTDQRIKNVDFNAVMRNHRQHLKDNAAERDGLVRRAALNLYGKEAHAIWRDQLATKISEVRLGIPYYEARSWLAEEFLRVAYTAMIAKPLEASVNWDPSGAPWRTISRYRDLWLAGGQFCTFKDVAKKEKACWNLIDSMDIWTAIATSEERMAAWGHFAPIPMTWTKTIEGQQVDIDYGKRILAYDRDERCLGDIGPGDCVGPQKALPALRGAFNSIGLPESTKQCIDVPDGQRMCHITRPVAVGSIVHDSTCHRLLVRHEWGHFCNGLDAETIFHQFFVQVPQWADLIREPGKVLALMTLFYSLPEGAAMLTQAPAAMEWNKAVWNVLERRHWQHTFGPYPDPGDGWPYGESSHLFRNFSDDVREASARDGKMALIVSGLGLGPQVRYVGPESLQTRALAAPTGTLMDPHDVAFCASGKWAMQKTPPVAPDTKLLNVEQIKLQLDLINFRPDIGYKPGAYGILSLAALDQSAVVNGLIFHLESMDQYRTTSTCA